MKKIYLLLLACAVSAGIVGYRYLQEQRRVANSSPQKTYRIALLSPAIHPSIEKIEKAYQRRLGGAASAYQVTTFNAAGDAQRLNLFAQNIVSGNFDAICTIGTNTTLLINNLRQKRGIKTPQIFAAVPAPQQVGLAENSPQLAGVVEENDIATHLDIVSQLMPRAKHFLLVYCPTSGQVITHEKSLMEHVVKRLGGTFSAVAIFSPSEIPAKTTQFIQRADVVVVLKDNVVVTGLDVLLKICNSFGKPVIASDLDSVDRGALSALGVHEEQFGTKAAELTIAILAPKSDPAPIGFVPADTPTLKLNSPVCARYGIDLAATDALRHRYPLETTKSSPLA
ncbi:MAG: hypothetical protein M1549_03750 [Candidatus Dependentiae bacterium]|nr:hypothetical protein [Candidatus Dependentiae bacterium]